MGPTDAYVAALFMLIAGLAIGYLLGSWLADYEWRLNAMAVSRKESKGRRYKVIDTEQEASWAMAEIYKPKATRGNYE